MGWTHDYNDVGAGTSRGGAHHGAGHRSIPDGSGGSFAGQLGIPRIIRRRARWVSARLRHTRGVV
ncbi:hypothetical protein AB0M28_00115 [Streptomyces sp. NPDC051940]|uniref:hypothetical protein n=1 Tax=Streptomyces sp. NPDC051940 TaxID=3155675 RepID=UPI00344174E8